MGEAWEANRDGHLDVLQRVRDPAWARANTRPVSQWTAATRAARIEKLAARRGRELTDREKHELGDELSVEEWCRRVRAMLAADASLTVGSINRSFNMSQNWAYRRLQRYPGP